MAKFIYIIVKVGSKLLFKFSINVILDKIIPSGIWNQIWMNTVNFSEKIELKSSIPMKLNNVYSSPTWMFDFRSLNPRIKFTWLSD